MALQIGLPGQGGMSKTTIGIDLGTTNSLVATVRNSTPMVLSDDNGNQMIPSVVAYINDPPLVGVDAIKVAVNHPTDTIFSIKRLMGRAATDPEVQSTARGYHVVDSDGGMLRLELGSRTISPVEMSADILRALKARAEKVLKHRVLNAVITVPAYFDDAQRQATKDAGRLAGLEVMRLVNEPTAAALAYGLEKNREGTYAVYDLGGGTFDISILKLEDGVFEVLSTGGNTHLGGDDLDATIARVILEEAGYESDGERLPQALLIMARATARQAKEALSDADSVTVEFHQSDGGLYERHISREELEEWTLPIIERTGPACEMALRDAHLDRGQLDGVILVGGSTRMPLVRRYVKALFGSEPYTGVNPDEVVALGASIQAALLAGWKKDVLLLDVIPLSLGVETMGGIVEKLIHRNSTIPASATQEFTTFADSQTGMDIHVVQGEREMVKDCRSLGRFRLTGIPPLPAGVARVSVTFSVDSDGILRVSAKEERTGVEQSIEVKPAYGLSDSEVERMLREALENAQLDIGERLLRDARVEADRIVSATELALEADANQLLSIEERAQIERQIAALKAASPLDDHNTIQQEIEALDKATMVFAQRRMEQGIRKALTGMNVDEIAEKLGPSTS